MGSKLQPDTYTHKSPKVTPSFAGSGDDRTDESLPAHVSAAAQCRGDSCEPL